MPYQKSLKEMCFNNITTEFDAMQSELEQKPLPPKFIHTICERLSQPKHPNQPETRLKSNIFIRPNTTSLHHLHMFDLPIPLLCAKIGQMCTNLVDLDLSTLPKIPSRHLIKLLRQIPQIQRLNLSQRPDCTDQIAAQIGRNCRDLIRLDLNSCRKITDIGLASLATCVKLQHLNVAKTCVTSVGCLHILNQLPVLRVFKNDYDLFAVLKRRSIRAYSLEETSGVVKNGQDLALLMTIFPKLTSLSVDGGTVLALDERERLGRLTSLHLMGIRLVSLRLVDRLCPRLEELKLSYCTILDEGECLGGSFFKNLWRLEVDSMFVRTDLRLLFLLCGNVEEVVLCCCEMFSDGLVSELVCGDGFGRLRVLDLWGCDSVGLVSILRLLEMRNPLRELTCSVCLNIGVEDCKVIKSYVESKNLDVNLSIR